MTGVDTITNEDIHATKDHSLTNHTHPKLYFAEILRALAIFAVIILHNAADYEDQYGQIPLNNWWAGVTWNGLVRFCVPMFVLLSGAFLLKPGKEISISEVFYKRLPKIIIPLVFWSIAYILFEQYSKKNSLAGIDVLQQLKIFYKGPVVYHLWFLYMMIGIYLLYPIINLFITAAKPIHILYFLIVWGVTNCILGLIEIHFSAPSGIDLSFFTGYVGYFVLGYYLFNHTFTEKQLKAAYVLAIASFFISIFFPYICILLNIENHSAIMENDFTPDILFVEIGLFLWFKNRSYKGSENRIITEISNESFGIYLIHVMVMQYIFSEKRSYMDAIDNLNPWWSIPVKSIVILIISFIIIKLIRQIPYLRRVAG